MPAVSVAQAFELALQHHQAGRLVEADALYRQILAAQPNHSDALHLLGVIADQAGRHDLAVDCIRRAIVLDPKNPGAYSNLGVALAALDRIDEAMVSYRQALDLKYDSPETHVSLGNAFNKRMQFDEAIGAYRQALKLNPKYATAYNSLGVALRSRGELNESLSALRQAIALKPDYAEAHSNLGIVLIEKGCHDEALTALHRAIDLKPDSPEIYDNLGAALAKQGRLDEAVAMLRRALALRPGYAEAHTNLGVALTEQGHFGEARDTLQRALALRPGYAEAHTGLGTILSNTGHYDEAVAAHRRAIDLKPDYAEAHYNLGSAHFEQGRLDEAAAAYRRALELKPDLVTAGYAQAHLRLLRGDFEHGWPLYELRWEACRLAKRDFVQPMWDGKLLDKRRVLVHGEQGFGDCIQFIRYAELAAARGAHVILACQESVVELLRGVKGVSELVKAGDPLPPFDLHVPMLSQPLVFQTRRETIPNRVPYLSADPKRRETWQGLIGRLTGNRRRVGMAWAGNAEHSRNHMRSISLETLLPLLAVDRIDFYNLQIGPEAGQILQLPGAAALVDLTSHIRDFADTAALMMHLDLIISVDTAVAHLAGALGKPVWTLLPFVPDWRWMLDRDDSPWYPTMRLFRQPKLGDWDSVIHRVADELRLLVKSRNP